MTSPAGSGERIIGFAAQGQHHLAVIAAPIAFGDSSAASQLRLSDDGGHSWSDVAWPFPAPAAPNVVSAVGASAGPDGKFYVAAVRPGTEVSLVKIEPTSDATSFTSMTALPVPSGGRFRASEPVWDEAGRMWIAYSTELFGAVIHVLGLNADGSVAVDLSAPNLKDSGQLGLENRVGEVWLRTTSKYARVDATQIVEGVRPALRVGDVEFGTSAVAVQGVPVQPRLSASLDQVENDPGLIVQRLGTGIPVLLRKLSDVFWTAVGLQPPSDTTRVIRNGTQLLAVRDESRPSAPLLDGMPTAGVYAHDGPLPPAPVVVNGPLSPVMQTWMKQANDLRALAGLGPLYANATISKASENHSRYWTLNPSGPQAGSPHYETSGKPGFTGEMPADRCAFVGGRCSSEIMGGDPPTWIATIFHRPLLMDPNAYEIGGAEVQGGPGVMNDGLLGGLLTAPTGFPMGNYNGPLGFAGETPDPGEVCATKNISAPYGAAISAYVPVGKVAAITLRPEGGAPVSACSFPGDYFSQGNFALVPDAPLKKRTAYIASATWAPADSLPERTFTWRFVTGDDGVDWGDGSSNPGGSNTTCRRLVTTRSRKTRPGGRWLARITPCVAKRIKLTLRTPKRRVRVKGRKVWKRRVVWSRETRATGSSPVQIAVPARRLTLGSYQLQIELGSAAGKRLTSRTLTLTVRG